MVETFTLSHIKYPNSLHDCKISNIEWSNKILTFYFDKDGLDILSCGGKPVFEYQSLKVSYILKKYFDDSSFCVSEINAKKRLFRTQIKYYNLNNFISNYKNLNCVFRVYAQYFNNNKCLIQLEAHNKKIKMGEKIFEIELDVSEIIYDWSK